MVYTGYPLFFTTLKPCLQGLGHNSKCSQSDTGSPLSVITSYAAGRYFTYAYKAYTSGMLCEFSLCAVAYEISM